MIIYRCNGCNFPAPCEIRFNLESTYYIINCVKFPRNDAKFIRISEPEMEENPPLVMPDVKVSTYITCSAIWFNDGKKYTHQPSNIDTGFVICGHRHHNCFMTAYILNKNEKLKGIEEIQGFMTNENNFVDRIEGGQIAFKSGQTSELKTMLFSEDLY